MPRSKRDLLIFAVIGMMFASILPTKRVAAANLDYELPNGHFFTQANGQPTGSSGAGFGVTDEGGAFFWRDFQKFGGVPGLGYPVSRRFSWNGYTTQAMQKMVLQWRADEKQVYFVNIFDLLHEAGKDDWLQVVRQVPPMWETSADTGLPWAAVMDRHLAFLQTNPAIKARYWADSDPFNHFGLPMSYADMGNVFVVRAQRAVFQYWKIDTPWARANTVTVANGGDLAKELGLFPVDALLPEGESGRTPVRWAYLVTYDPKSLESLQQHFDTLDYVSPGFFSMDARAVIKDEGNAAANAALKGHKFKVLPMIQNSVQGNDFHALLGNPDLRRRAVEAIHDLVTSRGYDGINIDFEGIAVSDRPNLTTFMAMLSSSLRPKGKLVTMAVPAKAQEAFTGWAGAYDYAALAPHNDLILIMAYGFRTSSSSTPGPNSPLTWVEGCSAYAAAEMGAEKVILGLAWYGYDWNLTKGPPAAALRFSDAVNGAQRNGVNVQYDEKIQAPHYSYTANGAVHEVWFEDARSFEAKLAMVKKYNLAGVGGWRLGHEDPAVWNALANLPLRKP